MYIGVSPLSDTEILFRSLRFDVSACCSKELGPEWTHDLCSPFWRLYVHDEPGGFVECGADTLHFQSGMLYLIPAWLHFTTGIARPAMQHYIHFDFLGLPAGVHRSLFTRVMALPLPGTLARLCTEWVDSMRENQAVWLQFARSFALVYSAMAAALERNPEGEACFAWISRTHGFQPVLDHIDRSLSRPPGNEELARLCHMSTGHFIRRFSRALGKTPLQYIMERRLSVAARWLTSTERSINDISDSLGFSDRFHFSKAFRHYLRITPAAYRHMHRTSR